MAEVTSDAERRAARVLADGEARVSAAQQKLAELERYAGEYRATLDAQAAGGIDAARLHGYHGFIARLGEAVAQQALILRRAREERDLLRDRWLDASRRARAVGKVVESATRDERREQDRRDQHEFDERAQRAHLGTATARAHGRA